MKGEGKHKPHGMKHRIREEKRREEHIGFIVIVAVLIAIVSISAFLINSMLNKPSTNPSVGYASQPKAAIVDHLSLTAPNQTFIQTTTNTLKQAGYTVDYYSGEEVTVEFYRNLPTHNHGLIIFRVHSSATNPEGTENPVTLFTSERYERAKYVYEQLTDQLVMVGFSQDEREKGITYFGISALFVTQAMKGKFQNTIIIMMGCEGLDNPLMAKAFVENGAKVYISWNQPVLASHTDLATTHLLQHFLIEKRTLKESVQETFKDVGADPVYKSLLIYYPLEAGDYTIQNIVCTQFIISIVVEIKHKEFSETKHQTHIMCNSR